LITPGLIAVFADKTRGGKPYQEQAFAGKLLYELRPETNISLKNIPEKTLDNYNLSVEELPLYIRDKFGIQEMKNMLEIIEKENSNAQVRESIRAFRHWLK
jgi:hypothetical protein